MTHTSTLTIADRIELFLEGTKDGVATLKEIYNEIQDKAEETIRCSIYRDKKGRFKKVAKGIYMLNGEKTASLFIKGDGRKLDEIEDSSVDTIITDHPWEDKKAHRSGNNGNLAPYKTFKYTQEDFNAKSRVLREGGYLVEFLPVESATNYLYLQDIKRMAKEAGLNYYAKVTWRKDKEGTCNMGRTTKGVEDICIFYKGKKPRKLSRENVNAYQTTEILNYTIDIPANKGKEKMHKAEKPIKLYEYLIEQFTKVKDVVLDQFAGSGNLLKAAINKNRFGIAYETNPDFVSKTVERFNCYTLFDNECEVVDVSECDINTNINNIESMIPIDVSTHQLKYLNNLRITHSYLFTNEELIILEHAKREVQKYSEQINNLFNSKNLQLTKELSVPNFDIHNDIQEYHYNQLKNLCYELIKLREYSEYLESQYNLSMMEVKPFLRYCVSNEGIFKMENIKGDLERLLGRYAVKVRGKFKNINVFNCLNVISNFLSA